MYRLIPLFLFWLFVRAQEPRTYDYIVVGSGPGGGPLAANLARANHTVLLLEAGDDQGGNINTTLVSNRYAATNDPHTRWDFFVSHTDDPKIEEQYFRTTWRTTDGGFYVGLDPPANASRLGIWYPRAGTLGGCAMHNAAIAALPANADWQYIADITGDTSWKAENMRKFLVKLERCNYLPNGSTIAHGFDGWLDTSMANTSWAAQPSDERTLASLAAGATGFGNSSNVQILLSRDMNNDDPDRDTEVGIYSPITHATPQGIRSSPNNYIRATLEDAKHYNLSVNLNSLVTKILFSNETNGNPTAIGVEFLQGRSLYKADPRYTSSREGALVSALASKEVIISGGAFNSPQILKLSGIGPAAELQKFNIPIVKDLPGVGMNMRDNYEGGTLGTYAKPVLGGSFYTLYRTSLAKLRNIFFLCGAFAFEGFWPGFPSSYPNNFECSFVHMNPKHINGSVTLKSANPQDVPEIKLGYFTQGADEDLDAMFEGAQLFRNIFRSLPNNTFTEMHPCTSANCTDASMKEYLRTQAWSHHVTGSCRMGLDDDAMAVVDSRFRVRGVNNLRVVDGSVFPTQPGAFPVLPTFMISEKAAEDILATADGA